MSRRSQFSVWLLLRLTAVACLFFGGRHLLETYGSRLGTEAARAKLA